MKLRHWESASSTGASAREVRIELAMMMPAVACWLITSQAPIASTRRLQDHAQDLRQRRHAAGDVGHALLGGEMAAVVDRSTASSSRPRHAHRLDDLGIAPARLGQRHCGCRPTPTASRAGLRAQKFGERS